MTNPVKQLEALIEKLKTSDLSVSLEWDIFKSQQLLAYIRKLEAALEKIREFDPSDELTKRLMLMTNPPRHAAVHNIREIARAALKDGE